MDESTSRRDDILLGMSAYVLLGVIAVVAFQNVSTVTDRWTVVALLLTFGVVMWHDPDVDAPARQVHLYLGIQTIVIISALFLLAPFFSLLFFVLSVQAMLLLPSRVGLLWIALFTLISCAAYFTSSMGLTQALLQSLISGAGFLFFGAFGHAFAQVESGREESQRLLTELQDAHRQLQEYAERAEELAVAEERNRLAREMHDTLGHRLTVAAVQLEGAQRLIGSNPERAEQMVVTVREQVRAALQELRSTVATLRTPLQADLSLSTALSRLAREFEDATDLTVHVQVPDEELVLEGPQHHAIYRAAQEGLTNVQRHARARDIWVDVRRQNGQVVLAVRDNGVGISGDLEPGENAGFGLRGLRERADQLNGECYLEPRPGGGTQMIFRLPIAVEERRE